MPTLTLVGTRLAEPDQEFVYRGEAPACDGCPYRDQCLNLTVGRRYRVASVRDGAPTLECGVHDAGVRAVHVEPVPVRANVASDRAYAGTTVELPGPCPHAGCPSHAFCVPEGAAFDEGHRIRQVVGDPPHEHCALDRDLTLVEFEPGEE